MKMVYSVEQNAFVNEECVYSVTACKREYLAKYRDLMIQETSLKAHIRDVINRFVQTGNASLGTWYGSPYS